MYADRKTLTKHYYQREESAELKALNSHCLRKKCNGLRVMYWNMHGFVETRDIPNYASILYDILSRIQPDLFAVVEYTPFAPHDMLCTLFPYFHAQSGIALYATRPFTHVGTVSVSPGRYVSDYIITDDPVHLYVTHLSPSDIQDRIAGIKALTDYKQKNRHEHVVLVGDFNHVDAREMPDRQKYMKSYAERNGTDYMNIFTEIDRDFCDTFKKLTVPPPCSTHWTGTRIDFAFVTKNIMPTSSYICHTTLSDHLPIITDLTLRS